MQTLGNWWDVFLERVAEPIGDAAVRLWELVAKHGWPILMLIPMIFSFIFAMTNMTVREFVLYPLEVAMTVAYAVIVGAMMWGLAKSPWPVTIAVTLTAIVYGLVPHMLIYHVYRYGLIGRWTFGYWQTLGIMVIIGAVSIVLLMIGAWLIRKILAAAFAVKQWYGNQKTWVKWLVWIGLAAIVVAEILILRHAWSFLVILVLVVAISRTGPRPTQPPTVLDPNAL
jgi:hypothetical protein